MMNFQKNKYHIFFMIALFLFFLFYYWSSGNIEFILHLIIFEFIFLLLILTDKKYKYPKYVLWMFCIWALFHMLGGAVFIEGTRLYSFIFLDIVSAPFYILRFDQVIHIYCYFIVTLLLYSIAKTHLKKVPIGILFIVFFASIGISAINEIIEFFMAINIANNGIGDYYNTSLDLIANFLGSLFAILFIKISQK